MLTPQTWDDFAALVEANNGVWGGCWCIGFHPEGVGHGREGNRDLKHQHVTRGTVHQVLVYDGERCVGWCQFGPPAEVATVNNARAYEKGLAELPDWRIGCIFTSSKDRGRGVAGGAGGGAGGAAERRRGGGGGARRRRPRRRSRKSDGPAAASSRPTRSRPRNGRRSGALTCIPAPKSCTRATASPGIARSRSGAGSCAPRSDPASYLSAGSRT